MSHLHDHDPGPVSEQSPAAQVPRAEHPAVAESLQSLLKLCDGRAAFHASWYTEGGAYTSFYFTHDTESGIYAAGRLQQYDERERREGETRAPRGSDRVSVELAADGSWVRVTHDHWSDDQRTTSWTQAGAAGGAPAEGVGAVRRTFSQEGDEGTGSRILGPEEAEREIVIGLGQIAAEFPGALSEAQAQQAAAQK